MERLLRPKSIAVVGGGDWCKAVIAQNKKIGFKGKVWHVHPTAKGALKSVKDLPDPPDAAFVGVNREAAVEVIADLAEMGAGGAVCFASGFAEAQDGAALNASLLRAAGKMPVLGPNCYGLINALDGSVLWPDQHGLEKVDKGVAIIAQSSNIALNLTMQARGLPIAYAITPGNQAQQSIASIGMAVLRDERVTALGLYVESFGNVAAFEALSALSRELNKPIVALKVGHSQAAQIATVTHTASLAGSAAGAGALMARLGIAQVPSLPVMLETLKVYHCFGRLPGVDIASLSCSGGEAAMIGDVAARYELRFAPLEEAQYPQLAAHLSDHVSLTNPLDYHTDIWRDQAALTAVFSAMSTEAVDLTMVILDMPHGARCDDTDWQITLSAVEAAADVGGRFAVLASLPENMPEAVARRLMDKGIVPLCDFDHACAAIRVAATQVPPQAPAVVVPPRLGETEVMTEGDAKAALAEADMDVPRFVDALTFAVLPAQAMAVGFPVALKAEGVAHKTEAGGVALNLTDALQVMEAARAMDAQQFMIEEMIQGTVAELLVGVVADPAHGFVLTIAAGGTAANLMSDRQSLLLPVDQNDVLNALARLRIADLLRGYRGQPGAHIGAIVQAILDLQDYVLANARQVAEVEVNPLICTPERAVVGDALLVRAVP